jgi:hypothetical protein
LFRLDLKNVLPNSKKGMSRYVEINHNGKDIVLCLASSVEQAKSECRRVPGLDLEQYESWAEVRDGTDSTNWELFNEALRSVAGGEELRNSAYRSKHIKEELSGKASESVAHVHSGTSQKTNDDKDGPKVPTRSIFEQPELMVSGHFKTSNKEKKVDEADENKGHVHTAPTPTTVGSSDRFQNGDNVESSKANEAPNTAKQAGKAGGAFKTRASKKASDTSSSSSYDGPIAERTRSKKPRRSARLAVKNNGNKSK